MRKIRDWQWPRKWKPTKTETRTRPAAEIALAVRREQRRINMR